LTAGFLRFGLLSCSSRNTVDVQGASLFFFQTPPTRFISSVLRVPARLLRDAVPVHEVKADFRFFWPSVLTESLSLFLLRLCVTASRSNFFLSPAHCTSLAPPSSSDIERKALAYSRERWYFFGPFLFPRLSAENLAILFSIFAFDKFPSPYFSIAMLAHCPCLTGHFV